mmetsp:Transcript_17087/g.25884  ORF Transcript_17087/g.25884 Transcript_17087/m.25884 type:complete len:170 (+) Transcript_17087:185-694(+)|eukprot:CAMPEP_0178906622 /NCGR_PEP_ID=MMETSP0786-20121207/6926_1 /TAXON_ID=186022 /ORGANISM="Thalassionema frauenfeldii, Strain CCMP 1798" /LENGTH=169 /DNA_ID=CAMNT_0020578347 /DNA_START=179 /DNA_END=688 /DNA_ORIENTATION=+
MSFQGEIQKYDEDSGLPVTATFEVDSGLPVAVVNSGGLARPSCCGRFWQWSVISIDCTLAVLFLVAVFMMIFGLAPEPPKVSNLSTLDNDLLLGFSVLIQEAIFVSGIYGALHFKKCMIWVPLVYLGIEATVSMLTLQIIASVFGMGFMVPHIVLISLIRKGSHMKSAS